MGGDLQGLVRTIKLSRATMRNIRQNLVFAFGYNALGIPIAAGALYPVFGLLPLALRESLAEWALRQSLPTWLVSLIGRVGDVLY